MYKLEKTLKKSCIFLDINKHQEKKGQFNQFLSCKKDNNHNIKKSTCIMYIKKLCV